jgi:alkylation response protein AidB-like acyl-CoA dehydrogenase
VKIDDPTIPDLLYSGIEEELRAAVASVLVKRAQWPSVLKRTESEQTADLDLWNTLAGEVGIAGLAVPESSGGAGASWREVATVLEELGRAIAPIPFLGSAVSATALLLDLDETELLKELAEGRRIAGVAVSADTTPWEVDVAQLAVADSTLTGSIRSVSDVTVADLLLVPVDNSIVAVETRTDGVTMSPVVSLDMTRQLTDIEFVNARARVIATGDSASRALSRSLTISAGLLASEQLGLAERCLDEAVEYVQQRHQFGRPIGSYQALKHRLADLWADINLARATARYFAGCAATNSPDLAIAGSIAHSVCSEVAVRAAEECIQLHGGIGFTWEHPSHLFLKRAKSSMLFFGGPDRHRRHIGRLVGLDGPAS